MPKELSGAQWVYGVTFSEQCRDVPASGRRMGQFFTGRG